MHFEVYFVIKKLLLSGNCLDIDEFGAGDGKATGNRGRFYSFVSSTSQPWVLLQVSQARYFLVGIVFRLEIANTQP